MSLNLALVMPVYNEQDCIAQVVRSWIAMLDELQTDYRLFILNDGSTDHTALALEAFCANPRVEVISKENSGHGPTILQGYRMAVDVAEWVFQCDSDDEIGPEHFPAMWKKREDFDALIGIRVNRKQPIARRLISMGSRFAVRILFGAGVRDVNAPYRLIRASLLGPIVAQIPADTFAPNVIISGALSRARVRIHQAPVLHRSRRTGTVSIVKWKLWKAAARSLLQTLHCRPRVNLSPAIVAPYQPRRASFLAESRASQRVWPD